MKQLDTLLKEHLKYPESKNLQQRGIADKIEDECNRIIITNLAGSTEPRSRRSIEDVNIMLDGKPAYVDHKTSDEALNFKMPNMISIARLKTLDRPLIYSFVIYNSKQKSIIKTFTLNVYELNWDYLKIQNLGKGQLQITNMKEFLTNPKTTLTKQQWLTTFQQEAVKFYKKVQLDAAKREKEFMQWNPTA